MIDQNTLFTEEEKRRTRVQNGFKRSSSKDGTLSIQIDADLAEPIRKHCRIMNVNCRKFVTDLIRDGFDEVQKNKYNNLTKEELIEVIKKLEGEAK